jgi:hypothetical protein
VGASWVTRGKSRRERWWIYTPVTRWEDFMTNFVQASEFPHMASLASLTYHQRGSSSNVGARAVLPSTNEIAHMMKSCVYTHSHCRFCGPRGA